MRIRVKRVLFLADRNALVKQAVNAFERHLPDSSPVNLVTEPDGDGRVFVCTYPTMMNMVEEARDGQRRYGLGLFVRSLVGLDREAAKAALGVFMSGKTLPANQIAFLDLIVNHLTERGSMEPSDRTPHQECARLSAWSTSAAVSSTARPVTSITFHPRCSKSLRLQRNSSLTWSMAL